MFGERRIGEASAGMGRGGGRGVIFVVEKGEIVWRREIERRDVGETPRQQIRGRRGAGQGGDLSQRETPRASMEYRLAHAASSVPPIAVKIRTSCRR